MQIEPCQHAPVHVVTVSSRDREQAADMFRALGDPARLLLMELLSQGERCVSELALQTGQEISTISQRLKVLRAERLIVRRRDGKHIYYALADKHVMDLVQSALEHAGEPMTEEH